MIFLIICLFISFIRPIAPVFLLLTVAVAAAFVNDGNGVTATSAPTTMTMTNVANLHSEAARLLESDRPGEAEPLLRRVVELDPCHSLAHANLAVALLKQNRLADALAAAAAGVDRREERVFAVGDGEKRDRGGDGRALVAATPDPCRSRPVHWHAHGVLGNALLLTGRLREAAVHGAASAQLAPAGATRAKALVTLGNMLEWDNRLDDALVAYRNATHENPGAAEPQCKYVDVATRVAEWDDNDYAKRLPRVMAVGRSGIDPLVRACVGVWQSMFLPFAGAATRQVAEAHARGLVAEETGGTGEVPPRARFRRWWPRSKVQGATSSLPNLSSPLHPPPRSIRVAYLGAEWDGAGPIGRTLRGIFRCHNAPRVEVHVISLGRPRSETEDYREVAGAAHAVHDVSGQSFDAIAALIRDEIRADVLVDTGHWLKPQTLRVLARAPAPVAVAIPAAPGTTGLPRAALDWITTDRFASPVHSAAAEHTEALMLFDAPHRSHFMANNHRAQFGDLRASDRGDDGPGDRGDPGDRGGDRGGDGGKGGGAVVNDGEVAAQRSLARASIVFASFSTLFKVDPALLQAWTEIVSRVPGSVLWLQRGPLEAEPRLRAAWARRGLDPGRLVFSDRLPRREHLARVPRADIALDTPAYTGHSTTMDTLWGGVPVITVHGSKMATRTAVSVIRMLGGGAAVQEAMIAPNLKGYINRAVRLAQNPGLLAELRAAIRAAVATTPLYDTCAWVAEWERGLEMAVETRRSTGRAFHLVL
jgi:protein O-GlcNAc transferase